MDIQKITCIVDNAVQRGSSFRGEHGLAFWIETDQGCVLFDTGGSTSVLRYNLGLLGWSLCDASALVLSHAHYDHTGGLFAVLLGKPGLPLYAHPDLFRPRFSLKDGRYQPIGLGLTREDLVQLAELHLSDAPTEVLRVYGPRARSSSGQSQRAVARGTSYRRRTAGNRILIATTCR